MVTVAVICEYNLFHNGHARLISSIKEHFGVDTCVVSLMSGNFTQRGLPAAVDKYVRANAALLSGSDITLELPAPYAFSVAERFAGGGVELAGKLGCIDYLAFGSEVGDIKRLVEISNNFASSEFNTAFNEALTLTKDESYIRVRQKVYETLYGEEELLPNDQLGIEYISAIRNTRLTPAVFKRTGGETATESRNAFLCGDLKKLASLVPASALQLYMDAAPARYENISSAVLSFLRLSNPDTISLYEGMNKDLAYCFVRLAGECSTINEFFDKCATKKYTRSRIRRGVLNCILGVTANDFCGVGHTLVLSANDRGCELLAKMKKTAQIPIYTKGAAASTEISKRSDALYTLAFDKPLDKGAFLRKSPIIFK